MKKIRVLFVINSLAGGGAERVLSYILNNLDRKLFDISLVTFAEERDYEILSDINQYSFNKRNYLGLPRIISKLTRLFRSRQYDLIVSFLTYTNIFVTISWLLAGKKIPLIISERCDPKYNLKNQRFGIIKIKLLSLLYPLSDLIVTPSKGVAKRLAEEFNIPASKIHVIYNPLDLAMIDKMKKEKVFHHYLHQNVPIILSCGRLTAQKNHFLLIKSFRKIIDKKLYANLVIMGDGEERLRLEKLVNDLQLKDNVYFLGFQKNPYKYMKNADVFVLASNYEGFPNVLLEAMACGLPVISTDCPCGPDEIIKHGQNGFLVPVDDETSLAKYMEILIKDSSLRNHFSQEGRKFVEKKFKLEVIIKEWEKLFLEVVK